MRKFLLTVPVIGIVLTLLACVGMPWVRYTLFPTPYRQIVMQVSKQYGIDPLLVAALIYRESRFNALTISSRDAYGLMQVRLLAVEELQRLRLIKEQKVTPEMLLNETFNVHAGVAYLKHLIDRCVNSAERLWKVKKWFQADPTALVLHCYHSGPTFVLQRLDESRTRQDYDQRMQSQRKSSLAYGSDVLRYYRWLRWCHQMVPYE